MIDGDTALGDAPIPCSMMATPKHYGWPVTVKCPHSRRSIGLHLRCSLRELRSPKPEHLRFVQDLVTYAVPKSVQKLFGCRPGG